jgi:general secretion pathway protein M
LIEASSTLPTGRRGQIVALGVTFIAIMAVWLIVVSPLIGFYSDRADTLSEQRAVLSRMEQLVATRQTLVARAAELGDAGPAKGALLDGSSIPVATAALQSLVQDAATAAGTTLTSVESLPGETGMGYRRVGVKLALSAPWPVLIHFLQTLQESDTPMAIDDLQIHNAPQGAPADQQTFDTAFAVYAPATAEPQAPKDQPAKDTEPPAEAPPAGDAPAGDTPADNTPPDAAPPADETQRDPQK